MRRVRFARRALLGLLVVAAACADTTADSGTETGTDLAAASASTTTTTTTITAPSGPDATQPTAGTTMTTAPSDAATTTSTTSTAPPTTTTTTTTSPATMTQYVVPVVGAGTSWGDTHSSYPATDIFVVGGCAGSIVSPVAGVALEVRRVDSWDPAVDDPATRGGRSVAILGDDGVRYYLAHFDTIESAIEPGARVEAGQPLGIVGETGRTSACHVHFGISPPCPDAEWSVRRGVIWPFPYLDAWRAGEQASPAEEVAEWSAANPDACAAAATGTP